MSRRLHVFDMDGTLLPRTTASLEIAKVLGGGDWLEALEAEFRLGEMATATFSQALHAGWSHLTAEDVTLAFDQAPKLEGIRRTVEAVHDAGDVAIVITMSPDFFVQHWLSYGFDVATGSRFPAPPFRQPLDPDGVLTFEDKPRIAAIIAAEQGISNIVAYGDSHSDVPLFGVAAISVAVNADVHVRQLATHSYSGNNLFDAYQMALSG